MFDDIVLAGARADLRAALRKLRDASTVQLRTEGLDTVEKRTEYADAIRVLWRSSAPEEMADVLREFNQAFRITVVASEREATFDSLVQDGWFADYLAYTGRAWAPAQLRFGAALTFISAGLGRRVRIDWQAKPLYPNLYTLLVGGTGAGKGAAIGLARSLVTEALEVNVLPNDGTMQGFLRYLTKRYTDTGLSSDGLIVSEEFKVLMGRDKHKEGLVEALTDWYDSPDWWARGLAKGEYELTNLCVSVLGASNMAWLRRMPEDGVLGGFLPRFLILYCTDGEERWGEADPQFDVTVRSGLVQRLRASYERGLPDRVWLDGESSAWMSAWHDGPRRRQFEAAVGDERLRSWLKRKQAAMLKIAVTWQFADGEPLDAIKRPWLEKAVRVLDWCDQRIEEVYGRLGTTVEGEVVTSVLEYLKRHGGELEEAEITRRLRNKYAAPRTRAALRILQRDGDVVCEMRGMKVVWRITQ